MFIVNFYFYMKSTKDFIVLKPEKKAEGNIFDKCPIC